MPIRNGLHVWRSSVDEYNDFLHSDPPSPPPPRSLNITHDDVADEYDRFMTMYNFPNQYSYIPGILLNITPSSLPPSYEEAIAKDPPPSYESVMSKNKTHTSFDCTQNK